METTSQSELLDQFEAVKAHALERRKSTLLQRKKDLNKLEKWILNHRGEIQSALYHDLKKPAGEADLTEIFVILSEIRKVRASLKSWMLPRPARSALTYIGTTAETYYEPKGACLIISPWNYPFQLCIGPLISALAAGNTVILKPSEHAPHTTTLIQTMVKDLYSPELVSIVTGGIPKSEALLALPFDHIFFTGSPRVGKVVMNAAARHLTSVTLELGGKSPTIVDKSAHIKDAAEKIAWGKWLNAGQTCIAPDYLFVHEDVRDKLIEELTLQSSKIYGAKENYGGIINREHHNRLNELMSDAIDKGADILFGGKSDRKHLHFSPTLLAHVPDGARVQEEEIFGPILPLMSYTDISRVVAFINQKPKPLALYVFSRTNTITNKLKVETSAGMMVINDCVIQFAHPHLPIGGVNNSGIGKAHGHAGFLAFSNEKAILKQRVGFSITKIVYPPFSTFKKFIIDFMVKYF